jgi:hypothetical protein
MTDSISPAQDCQEMEAAFFKWMTPWSYHTTSVVTTRKSLVAIKRDEFVAQELISLRVERVPIEVGLFGAGREMRSKRFVLAVALRVESIE